MNTTVTCQYTGIEFEAASKRTKNHPLVATFLAEASSDKHHIGAYAKAKELLAEAKGQSDDINEIVTAVTAAYRGWLNGDAEQRVRIVKKSYMTREGLPGEYDELTDGNAFSGTYRR